jgi:hypothetical protein
VETELDRQSEHRVRISTALGRVDALRPREHAGRIQCPFHDDGTASCSLFLGEDGTLRFHCLECDAWGDVFDLLGRTGGLEKTRFANLLRAAQALAFDLQAAPPRAAIEPGQSDIEAADGFTAAAVVSTLLSLCPLRSQRDASEYLSARQVLREAERDRWGALPPRGRQAAVARRLVVEFGLETLQRIGLLSSSGGFPWPEHRLLIPWWSPSGWQAHLQRRLVREPGEGEPREVSTGRGAPPFPYGVSALRDDDTPVAFVEGALDALSMRVLCSRHWVHRAVLAVPSASSWRASWGRLATGRVVVLALDRAGTSRQAVKQIADDVRAAGATRVVRVVPHGGSDWTAALQVAC